MIEGHEGHELVDKAEILHTKVVNAEVSCVAAIQHRDQLRAEYGAAMLEICTALMMDDPIEQEPAEVPNCDVSRSENNRGPWCSRFEGHKGECYWGRK